MTKHINIDEILEAVEDYPTSGSGKVIHRIDYKLLKQRLYDLMLEIIGSTELAPPKPDSMTQQEYMDYKSNMWARNDLRQEQRQKLYNLFKEDNE